MILTIVSLLLLIAYGSLLFFFRVKWEAIPIANGSTASDSIKVSVIIPARNEEENLPRLLARLGEQSYPKEFLEIIVVDDHSTDKTAAVAASFPFVKLIRLTADNINSYKKKAIETGIAAASGEWIITTDADCLPSKNWIAQIVGFQQTNKSVFIAAPVRIEYNANSLVQMFQAMDFLTLQGITGAVVYTNTLSMCNGANLSYAKDAFYTVNGFAGIDHIASGDDMLLMHKMEKAFPQQVHYLKSKEAIVDTLPMTTWKSFFNQRIRWASKSTQYNDKRILPILLLVYFFNLSFLALLVAACWQPAYFFVFVVMWLLKTLVEYPFFSSVSHFFQQQQLNASFFFLQPLHIFYTIAAGFLGQFSSYQWKGRKVK